MQIVFPQWNDGKVLSVYDWEGHSGAGGIFIALHDFEKKLLLSQKGKSSELSPGKVGFIQYSAAMLEILSQSYFLTYRYLRRAFKK